MAFDKEAYWAERGRRKVNRRRLQQQVGTLVCGPCYEDKATRKDSHRGPFHKNAAGGLVHTGCKKA